VGTLIGKKARMNKPLNYIALANLKMQRSAAEDLGHAVLSKLPKDLEFTIQDLLKDIGNSFNSIIRTWTQ
jgi:hypothetical protein